MVELRRELGKAHITQLGGRLPEQPAELPDRDAFTLMRIQVWRDGEWRVLVGGLPEPLPTMPYALVAIYGRLLAGLADGQLWESSDRGASWHACPLEGDALTPLNALVHAAA